MNALGFDGAYLVIISQRLILKNFSYIFLRSPIITCFKFPTAAISLPEPFQPPRSQATYRWGMK